MGHFRWLSNFYIILVAPPGIVSKSTTASIGMNLLRRVPGINFGPDVVTWQALVQSLAESAEAYEQDGTFYTMSAVTIESSELGNFINPDDRQMIDMLVNLWDGKEGTVKKSTKTQGNDVIKNPWVNIIACTTPAWLSNFPEYVIGGGFFSRTILVYAEEKARIVSYPDENIPPDFALQADKLVHDLELISQLAGPFTISKDARRWGDAWNVSMQENRPAHLDNDRFAGYLARKQTQLHKLAMILSVSKRDDLIIDEAELVFAATLLDQLEVALPRVFAQVGRNEETRHNQELLQYMRSAKEIEYKLLFRYMLSHFPTIAGFDQAIAAAHAAGYIDVVKGDPVVVKWKLGA